MTDFIADSGWAKFWLDAAQTIVLLFLAGYEFITRRTTANRTQIAEQQESIEKQRERIDDLEVDMERQFNRIGQAIRKDFADALDRHAARQRDDMRDLMNEMKEDRKSLYRRSEDMASRLVHLEGAIKAQPSRDDILRHSQLIQKLDADLSRLSGVVGGLEHLAKLGNQHLMERGAQQ